MKRSIYTLLLLAVLSLPAYTAITAVHGYLQAEQQKFNQAVVIVKRQALAKMMQAKADGNKHQYNYFRHIYNNAAKYTSDYGYDIILEKEKKPLRISDL